MSTASPPPRSEPARSGTPSADEREFDDFAQDQDPLDIAAATWATRKRSGLNAEQRAGLQAWLDADPRHAQALDDMEATLGELRRWPEPPAAAAGDRATRPGASGGVGLLRPLVLQASAAAVAFALVGGAWLGWNHWQRLPLFEQAYAAARGQQLTVHLPDAGGPAASPGSSLHLDTATRARVRLYRDRREVQLQDGQAMFAVASDPRRPFQVEAGALRITVLGTRFSVRHTATGLNAGATVVAVEEGHVRVTRRAPQAHTPTAEQTLELTAGQTVTADAHGDWGAVVPVDAHAVAAWREGRVSFEQTPLAQAIAEFERYGRTGLVVHDPAVASLPVGGSYSLPQWQRFVETLPLVLPVRLVRRGALTEVVAR